MSVTAPWNRRESNPRPYLASVLLLPAELRFHEMADILRHIIGNNQSFRFIVFVFPFSFISSMALFVIAIIKIIANMAPHTRTTPRTPKNSLLNHSGINPFHLLFPSAQNQLPP